MWDTIGILFTDRDHAFKVAVGLVVLVSGTMCGLVFTALSFTPLSTQDGVDTYQICAVIAFIMAILALLFMGYIVYTYEEMEQRIVFNWLQNQIEAGFTMPIHDEFLRKKVIRQIYRTMQ